MWFSRKKDTTTHSQSGLSGIQLREEPAAISRAELQLQRQRLPILKLTLEQYCKLLNASNESTCPKGFINYVPIGTRFICRGSKSIDDSVIGVVVKGEDALMDQWGSGLSIPLRFVNRYRPVIVE